MEEWVGVDLDGTLAEYDGFKGINHIGKPIKPMLTRVNRWIDQGWRIKIFTARASNPDAIPYIENWLGLHGLQGLEITNVKDFGMSELWDDRCVQVQANTGTPMCESRRGLE